MISRYFDQDKVMMLNAAYDTLESMSVNVLYVNSESGSIIFQLDQGDPIRMMICTIYPSRRTRIDMEKMEEAGPMNAQETELVEVIFDEMESSIKRIQAADLYIAK